MQGLGVQWEWMNDLSVESFPEPYKTMAQTIGVRNTVKLAKFWVGTAVYFPKLDEKLMLLRNKKIVEEFDGSNQKALAVKYGLTERWVYELLREKGPDENQLTFSEEFFENS